jgi:DNA-binding IclR family transcriptional regulator
MATEERPGMKIRSNRNGNPLDHKSSGQDDAASGRVEQIGVQSVEVAGHILKTLATLEGPQTLSALSSAAGLPPAKAHRYLVSLIREGFVEQSASDGRYDFGGAARLVGRVALNRLDIVRIGTPILARLRDDLRETVFMGVWTPQGAMVIEWLDIIRPVSVVIRPGSILPLHTSALGLICAAYLSPEVVARVAPADLPAFGKMPSRSTKPKKQTLEDIRRDGFSVVQGDLILGLDAIAVPVLDHKQDLVACLAAVGPTGGLDVTASGRVVRELKAAAERFAQALG